LLETFPIYINVTKKYNYYDLGIIWPWHYMTLALYDLCLMWPCNIWPWHYLTLTIYKLDIIWHWHYMILILCDLGIRGGASIGAGGGVMHPHLFQIVVFLLYWPTRLLMHWPPTLKFVAQPLLGIINFDLSIIIMILTL